MAASSKSDVSAFQDFHLLYLCYEGQDGWTPDEITIIQNRIADFYRLSGKELELVVRLAEKIDKKILFSDIRDILRLKDSKYVTSTVKSLERREFIRLTASSDGQDYITFDPRALFAFNRYEPYGRPPCHDFISTLRNCDESEIYTPGWIRNFRDSLNKSEDSEFKKGWISLGADELADNEAQALCFALKQFILHFTTPFSQRKNVANRFTDRSFCLEIPFEVPQAHIDSLVLKGFVIVKDTGYIIAPKVADILFHGHDEIIDYEEISKLTQVIKSCDIAKRELFFSPDSREDIRHLSFILSKEGYENACSKLLKKKRNPAIQSLLWGGPGTGKTEAVKQIARESGRDIFLFDVAKVTESDWGATESLYRNLFLSYRFIVAVCSLTPILFFNEADQVLSRRLTSLKYSIDKSENIVSNILLQEFEDMHGILLATTNNVLMLDEAFDRRFLFKTEIQKPDASARKLIWKAMIPELSDDQATLLAEKYDMSGAQISNVTAKYELAELYCSEDRDLSFIEMLCGKEMSIENKNSSSRRIGY